MLHVPCWLALLYTTGTQGADALVQASHLRLLVGTATFSNIARAARPKAHAC